MVVVVVVVVVLEALFTSTYPVSLKRGVHLACPCNGKITFLDIFRHGTCYGDMIVVAMLGGDFLSSFDFPVCSFSRG